MAHKYHAIAAEWRGVTYPSTAERDYAVFLDAMKVDGRIADWNRSSPVVLVPGLRKDRVTYIADFVVTRLDGTDYLVDVKGVQTPVFKVKRKLMRFLRPDIELLVVDAHGREV